MQVVFCDSRLANTVLIVPGLSRGFRAKFDSRGILNAGIMDAGVCG